MKKLFVAAAVASAVLVPMSAQAAKDTFNYGMRLEPPGLDPRTNPAAAISRITLYNIYEGLTRIDADGNVQPALAKSWTVSADGLVYSFALEGGVKFHDGSDFDSSDVKYTFEENAAEGSKNKRKGRFTNIASIETPDANTVILTLKEARGDFIAQKPGTIQTAQLGAGILSNGADATQQLIIDFNLDVNGPNPNEPTQFASNFEVTALKQDGLAVGRLTGIDIGGDGLVRATYSNGTSEPLARIALVSFANDQGLTQIGGTSWKESIVSGEALAGEAGSGTFGTINSSALEQSNVNLTTELIDLISAQRNFQANSRSLEVDNQLNQTILQIR